MEYNPAFRLFLQTRLAKPCFLPEVQAQCTLVDFVATARSLEEQLLARVVLRENPELEKEKTQYEGELADSNTRLFDLEHELVDRLAHPVADILSDSTLIEKLERTKAAKDELEESLQHMEETEEIVSEQREVYRSVAVHGSSLYFVLTQLCNIDSMCVKSKDSLRERSVACPLCLARARTPPRLTFSLLLPLLLLSPSLRPTRPQRRYTYSLDSFLTYFDKALGSAPAVEEKEEIDETDDTFDALGATVFSQEETRVKALCEALRTTIFRWVSRGLREEHKPALMLVTTLSLLAQGELLTLGFAPELLDFIVRGRAQSSASTGLDPSPLEWMTPEAWTNVIALAQFDEFSSLPEDIVEAESRFKGWCVEWWLPCGLPRGLYRCLLLAAASARACLLTLSRLPACLFSLCSIFDYSAHALTPDRPPQRTTIMATGTRKSARRRSASPSSGRASRGSPSSSSASCAASARTA